MKVTCKFEVKFIADVASIRVRAKIHHAITGTTESSTSSDNVILFILIFMKLGGWLVGV